MSTTSRSLLQSLAHQLTLLLDPVTLAMESPDGMERLLVELGVADSGVAGPPMPSARCWI